VVKHTDLPSRDMLCIINTKIQGMPCPAPPKSNHRVSRVCTIRPGLYRTDGLCPWGWTECKWRPHACFQSQIG
jgi:hypothetical protein